jgi:hypothetical protein
MIISSDPMIGFADGCVSLHWFSTMLCATRSTSDLKFLPKAIALWKTVGGEFLLKLFLFYSGGDLPPNIGN